MRLRRGRCATLAHAPRRHPERWVRISGVGHPGSQPGLIHHPVMAASRVHPVVQVELESGGVRHDEDGVPECHRRRTAMSLDRSATAPVPPHHHPSASPTSASRPPTITAST
jgi:hypothetical protein